MCFRFCHVSSSPCKIRTNRDPRDLNRPGVPNEPSCKDSAFAGPQALKPMSWARPARARPGGAFWHCPKLPSSPQACSRAKGSLVLWTFLQQKNNKMKKRKNTVACVQRHAKRAWVCCWWLVGIHAPCASSYQNKYLYLYSRLCMMVPLAPTILATSSRPLLPMHHLMLLMA